MFAPGKTLQTRAGAGGDFEGWDNDLRIRVARVRLRFIIVARGQPPHNSD
jgi:hypothetical protein